MGTDSVNENTDQSIISVGESEGNISHKNWCKSLQHFPSIKEQKTRIQALERRICSEYLCTAQC